MVPMASRLRAGVLWLPRRIATHLRQERFLPARTLLRLVRPHWRWALLAFLAHTAAAGFEGSALAFFALALQSLLGGAETSLGDALGTLGVVADRVLGGLGRDGMFLALVLLAVAMVILRSAFQFAATVASAYLEVRVFKSVWSGVFRQFMTMSFAQVSRYKVGDLNQYVWDAKEVHRTLWYLNLVLGDLLITLVYLSLLFWLSWPMTLIALVALLVLTGSLGGVLRRVRSAAENFVPARVEMGTRSLEYLTGLRLVRTFARETYATDQMTATVDEAMRQTWRRSVWTASIRPATESATVIGVAGFLFLGYFLMGQRGEVSILPRLLTFLVVLYRLMPLVGNINQERAAILGQVPLVRRVRDMLRMDDKEYTRDGHRPFQGFRQAIEFRNVSLRYISTEAQAVDDLSFDIGKGEMVALVGESGAGKSTVADLLLRLYDPTAGQVLVDGVDLRELRLAQWREHIGVVSQDTFLFNASIRDNIALGRLDAADEEIVRAAQVAHAHEFVTQLADGYNTVVGDRGYRLSGGQRQRIAIARAIVRHPEILVLDEATSNLDSESERSIQEAMEGLRADHTVLVIAHRLSTIVRADRILVLEGGRLVEEGTHKELLARNGRYARLWRLQAGLTEEQVRLDAEAIARGTP